ncbi:MAG: hypothetical protein AB1646_12140 [Thermodesulfobacteriota bacterium]
MRLILRPDQYLARAPESVAGKDVVDHDWVAVICPSREGSLQA